MSEFHVREAVEHGDESVEFGAESRRAGTGRVGHARSVALQAHFLRQAVELRRRRDQPPGRMELAQAKLALHLG